VRPSQFELDNDYFPAGGFVPAIVFETRESIQKACLRWLNQITHGGYSEDEW
jgi:hypothetical protein